MDTITDTTPATTTPATTIPTAAPRATGAPVRTLGIVSLVLGIAAIVTGFQIVMGAAAIVVGILALKQEPASKNFAIAGIVTGAVSAIGLVWGFLGLAGFAFLLPFAPLFVGDFF